MYGYMVRNAKKFGVLTTVNDWVFLMRENQGKLWITRPINCESIDPPFTIPQALYYISALTASYGELIETDHEGNPITIPLANSKYPHPAPSVTGHQLESPQQSGGATIIYSPPDSASHQYRLVNFDYGHRILLEPWKSGNHFGQKSFRAHLVPQNITVVVKLWDRYKMSCKKRDQEVLIYMHLQSLWGHNIPRLICSADIDFCYAIILQQIMVVAISLDLLTFDRAKDSRKCPSPMISKGKFLALMRDFMIYASFMVISDRKIYSSWETDRFGLSISTMLLSFLRMISASSSARTMK
jgi:hypothetical protein